MKTGILLPACCLFAAAAFAGPITYSFTGTATGTLGGTPFTDAAFTVVSMADTSQVTLVDTTYMVVAASSVIAIGGQPAATFTDLTYWADPQGAGDIIFGDLASNPTLFPGLLGITVLFQGLETYHLQTPLGPIFSALDFPSSIFHTFENIPTSQGSLTLVASNETFVAAVPEPSFGVPLLLALAVLAARRATPRAASKHPNRPPVL